MTDPTLARLTTEGTGEEKAIYNITVAYDVYLTELLQESDPLQALAAAGFTSAAAARGEHVGRSLEPNAAAAS